MTFRQFAFRNVFRNKRLYIAYFLSSMFTVMVFFTFANFAFHPSLTGENMNENVTQGMLVAGWIIYVFSFFFILYSMSSFLQSRKKEFGILMIQGMSNRQIRWMVFLENMIIGFFATIFGIGLGLAFSKLILLIAEHLLVLEDRLNFYFPTIALLLTFGSFIVLFFCISLFVTVVLRTNKLITLIKGDKIGKTEPRASILLTILAVLLIGSGYTVALSVEGTQVVVALFPVVIVVILGTYLFFTQLSVYTINKLKNNEYLFWKQTNMILFSDLSYRTKDNARAFFMVAIISTVAFSAIGTLVGLNSYLTEGLTKAQPISFVQHVEDEQHIEEVAVILEEYELAVKEAEVTLTYFEQNDGLILITTADQYNRFARLIGEEEISLRPNQMTVVEQSARNIAPVNIDFEEASIMLADETEIFVDKELVGTAKRDILPELMHYFIVGSDIYEQLGEPVLTEKIHAWQVISGDEENIIEAGRVMYEKIPGVTAIDLIYYDTFQMWSPILFVGLFIGLVFFVSAGSFLYFRLYTDLADDKEKFSIIRKIGLTTKEMTTVITKQIMILFFVPIIVALIHGAVALTALANLFGYNLVYESMIVLSIFFGIQIIYFIIVRYFYTKQVKFAVA